MKRIMEWLLRHLVRWLRRHRYARMAGRIRTLELDLGMVEPTTAEMYANPALIGDTPREGLPFALASAADRAAAHRLAVFADVSFDQARRALALPEFVPVPKLPPYIPDPRLTARIVE